MGKHSNIFNAIKKEVDKHIEDEDISCLAFTSDGEETSVSIHGLGNNIVTSVFSAMQENEDTAYLLKESVKLYQIWKKKNK